jgi:leucyl aminopeptidase (aminopeptidase T)
MTMTQFTISDHSDGIHVRLPIPAEVPVPKIAAALEKLQKANERTIRNRQERDQVQRLLLDAQSADSMRTTALNDAGEDDPDPLLLQTPAEDEVKKAAARVEPAERARKMALREARETIAENKREWQKVARKHAETARDRLALALRSLEVQQAELTTHLGVLELLHDDNLPTHLHSDWSYGAPEVSLAIDHLAHAVAVVDGRVRSL